jgi:hypothetical protein
MKPLPAEGTPINRRATSPLPVSTANRKNSPSVPKIYPVLLVTSTAISALFCFLYLTKPVLLPAPLIHEPVTEAVVPEAPATPSAPEAIAATVPDSSPASKQLPGDASVSAPPKPANANPFEETNLSIQHVVTAQAPGGITKRLDFKVPVLYRSRNLLWTTQDIALAHDLLGRLSLHQQKTHQLRTEAVALETAWNALIERSTPSQGLQADSPTLIGNQELPGTPATSLRNAQDSILIQPTRKE